MWAEFDECEKGSVSLGTVYQQIKDIEANTEANISLIKYVKIGG